MARIPYVMNNVAQNDCDFHITRDPGVLFLWMAYDGPNLTCRGPLDAFKAMLHQLMFILVHTLIRNEVTRQWVGIKKLTSPGRSQLSYRGSHKSLELYLQYEIYIYCL